MVVKKLSNPRGSSPRRLAAGLAGVALLGLSPVALAVQFIYGDAPQGPEEQAPIPDAPLRLAQVLLPSLPRSQLSPAPRDSLIETPLGLQPSRGLNMPGAASSGQPRRDVSGILPPIGEVQGDTAAGVAFDPRRPSTVVSQSETVSQNREGDNGNLAWSIPPIRWGGASGYALQRSSSSSGSSSISQSLFSNFSAASYIYAPWAATVSGRIGMTSTSSTSSAGDSGSANNQNRTSTVVGGADLNVFPTSRFPFQAYFDRSDSRASGNLVANDYVNTRVGLRQTYRGEDGVTSAGGQFDHSVVNTSNGATDTLTALSGNYATDIGIVKNSFSGRYSLGERSGTGERARLLGFNTSHNANLDDNLNISGNVSYLDNAIRTANGIGSISDNRTRFLQFNGFGTWMPEFEDTDELPLTLSGGVRYSNLSNEFAGQGVQSQSMGGNVNAMYRFSNNFTVGATGAINQVSTVGSPNILLTTLGTNANYAGNPLMFGNFSYNWNVGGNANWQSASGTIPSNYFLGGQASHSLGRFLTLSDTDNLSLSFSQSISLSQNQIVGNSTSLSNSLSASYGMRWGEQFTGTSTLSLSDILTNGVNAQHYRMLGFGFNGLGQLSNLSSANVNLQFNWNEQNFNNGQSFGFPTTPSNNQHMTLLGSASYTHSRFLGYRGLRYTLLFTADTRLRDERLLGDINGSIDRTRWTISNRLDYRIGLLDFRVNAALNDVGGKKNALLFFQVTRQIGAY